MGERKVLNKYIPHDFDPKLVPRGSKPKDGLVTVRMMLPFTIQCTNCSSFMYRGRKFNSKKEAVRGSEGKYLGIQRYRFYIKCSACSRPFTFLTDPKNADYEMETGGTRTYEVHKDKERTEDEIVAEEAQKEKEDPMKALEKRVLASQKEMAELDALDELKAMNMRHVKMMAKIKAQGGDTASAVLKSLDAEQEERLQNELELDEHDEALVKSIAFGKKRDKDKISVVRLGEAEEAELEKRRQKELQLLEKQQSEMANKAKSQRLNPLIKVKRKRKAQTPDARNNKKSTPIDIKPKHDTPNESDDGDALGLLGGYGSDSS